MRLLKVGMVQQSCGNDIPANIEKLKNNIRACALHSYRSIKYVRLGL